MLKPIDPELLFSRKDQNDPRIGDLVHVSGAVKSRPTLQAKLEEIAASTARNFITVCGYPDDKGIELNGGRIGAKAGPSRIRKYLYKMTPPAFLRMAPPVNLFDLGDLALDSVDLAVRHDSAQSIASDVLKNGGRVLSFGGGHDYGYPDTAAYCMNASDRPLVINFDAHLDVRPMDRGITSGTPFFRLLEAYPEIDFIELGLQGQCNARSHLDWLEARGGLASFEEERHAEGISLTEVLQRFLGDSALKRRSAFISVDIDGFSSAVAPGASQSWPTGFSPEDFFECLSWCFGRLNVQGLGIYEVAPNLDVDDRTSRLAALIAHRFMFQL